MTDQERFKSINTLSELYAPQDTATNVNHMPRFRDDPDGKDFDKYFNFLQHMYLLKASFMFYDETELKAVATELARLANQYEYPTNLIEAVLL